MSQKIGRNDPCWCKSGLKYKKCHLGRDKQPKASMQEVINIANIIKKDKSCYVFDEMKSDCVKKIVRAHTVPKSSIKFIAIDGHVYGLKQNLNGLIKLNGKSLYEKIGINEITTFTGFCQYHDNKLFEDIEKKDFELTSKTSFLLLYRAAVREYYLRPGACSMGLGLKALDKGATVEQQIIIQNNIDAIIEGNKLALRDMDFHKKEYFNMMSKDTYDNIRAVSFNMPFPPPVMCSALIFPKEDIDGNALQDLADPSKILDEVSFTSFYDGHQGRVVFSWTKSSDISIIKFLQSFLNKDKTIVLEYIFQYILQTCENLAISPIFWEELTESKRAVLNGYINPFDQPQPDKKDFFFNPSLELIDFSCSSIEKINYSQ